MLSQRSTFISTTSSHNTEDIILQKLRRASDPAKLRVYLSINQPALIVALNHFDTVIKGRLTADDIILIAGSKFENCDLISRSVFYSTLDGATQEMIATLRQKQERIKSHMSAIHPVAEPPRSNNSSALSPS